MNLHAKTNLAFQSPDAVRPPPAPVIALHGDPRAELAAQFIAAGSRVLDLSGKSELPRFLPHGCSYSTPERADAGDFPTQAATKSDVIVLLGALEQVADVESLFTHLRFCKQDVVLSYAATDLGGDRAGFVNHLSFYDLALLFDRFGFRIECTAPVDDTQVLMRLTPTERLMPVAPCSVAVVSGIGSGDFGDRLGYHMINSLLPGEAEVHHLNFRTLSQAREQYDLVVLGTGNGLFQPLLGDEVLGILGRAKASIGIFGTQFRELMPRPAIERVIERLDTWFARNEDDVLMYGRGRANVTHLGDWLIDQFPMVRSTDDEPLHLGDEMNANLPLDRSIQAIQLHKNVFSTRLHPLLCALTSAELAAYAEQPSPLSPDIMSGEFRSMLIDIFGRSYPEKKFFIVDRDAVARYKARVHRNVARVGERIDTLLRNVAVAAG